MKEKIQTDPIRDENYINAALENLKSNVKEAAHEALGIQTVRNYI